MYAVIVRATCDLHLSGNVALGEAWDPRLGWGSGFAYRVPQVLPVSGRTKKASSACLSVLLRKRTWKGRDSKRTRGRNSWLLPRCLEISAKESSAFFHQIRRRDVADNFSCANINYSTWDWMIFISLGELNLKMHRNETYGKYRLKLEIEELGILFSLSIVEYRITTKLSSSLMVTRSRVAALCKSSHRREKSARRKLQTDTSRTAVSSFAFCADKRVKFPRRNFARNKSENPALPLSTAFRSNDRAIASGYLLFTWSRKGRESNPARRR